MSGPGVGTRHEGLTSEGNVDQGWAAGEQPWEAWPELLAGTAREILGEIRAGHPEGAVNLLDGLLADLEARRRTLAELANEEG